MSLSSIGEREKLFVTEVVYMNRRECLKVTGRGALTVPGRLVVTTCLPVVFIAVMSFHYIPKLLHEILGVAWLLLVLLHLYQNRSWLKNLRQGSWSFRRLLGTVIDSLLILGVLVTILSGLGISNYLLKDVMPLAVQRSIALHQYHVSLPYALLILSGLHWGLHWQGWQRQWQKRINWSLPKMAGRLLTGTLVAFVLVAGVCGSFMNRAGDRLLMKHIFATEASSQPGGIYVLLLAGMLGLYVLGGIVLGRSRK